VFIRSMAAGLVTVLCVRSCHSCSVVVCLSVCLSVCDRDLKPVVYVSVSSSVSDCECRVVDLTCARWCFTQTDQYRLIGRSDTLVITLLLMNVFSVSTSYGDNYDCEISVEILQGLNIVISAAVFQGYQLVVRC